MQNDANALLIGLVSISDRASTGVYQDQGLPSLEAWLDNALTTPWQAEKRLIPDERAEIEFTLKQLVDDNGCHLILTTGGTGPALRDVTPEATLAIADKEMPGFGEQMRQISLQFVPTAILSRQVAVIRDRSLIINLPGQPKSIAETLEGLKDAEGKSAEAAKPFLESPLWQTLRGRKVDVDDSRWMSPVSIQGAHMILDDLSDTFEVDKQNS